jgi:DNA-directed RNA polymerase subunit F
MNLSTPTQQSFEQLSKEFETHRYDLLWTMFFPKKLAAALTKYPTALDKHQAALEIYQAYTQLWFFQKWFFKALKTFNASVVIQTLAKIQPKTNEDISLILSNPSPMHLNKILNVVQNKFHKQTFSIKGIIHHPHTEILSKLLNALFKLKLVSENYFQSIILHPNSWELYHTLQLIEQIIDIPEAEQALFFQHILQHQEIVALYSIFNHMYSQSQFMYSKDEFYLAVNHPQPKLVSDLFNHISKDGQLHGVLSDNNIRLILVHQNIETLFTCLRHLENSFILTHAQSADNLLNILLNKYLIDLNGTFACLETTALLKKDRAQKNFEALLSHPNPKTLYTIFQILKDDPFLKGLRAQSFFDGIVFHASPVEIEKTLLVIPKSLRMNMNLDVLLQHSNPNELTNIFELLKSTPVLTGKHAQEHFNMLMNFAKPSQLKLVLELFIKSKLLNEPNHIKYFEKIIQNQRILTDDKLIPYWKKLLELGPSMKHIKAIIEEANIRKTGDVMKSITQVKEYIKQEILSKSTHSLQR